MLLLQLLSNHVHSWKKHLTQVLLQTKKVGFKNNRCHKYNASFFDK